MVRVHVVDMETGQYIKKSDRLIFEGLPANRAYIAFLADFHFLQDQANIWQTDLC